MAAILSLLINKLDRSKRDQERTQGGGVKTPLELDILQKLYYLRKED